jgi:zinc transport system permease protein
MYEEFFIRALIGAIGLALITGPMSCLVLWKRFAYFGDAISHAALLGVALAFIANISPAIGSFIITLIIAILLIMLRERYSNDSLLAMFSYSCLAGAIIVISLIKNVQLNISSYLFGDILAISNYDIIAIYLIMFFIIGWLLFRWRQLLVAIIYQDYARAENINDTRIEIEFILMMALFIMVSFQLVGTLLIPAMLIMPAMAVRRFSKTPEQMVILATIVALLSTIFGLFTAAQFDLPAGAAIILNLLVIFIATHVLTIFSSQ